MANDTATLSELFAIIRMIFPLCVPIARECLSAITPSPRFGQREAVLRNANCIAVWHDSWMPTMHA